MTAAEPHDLAVHQDHLDAEDIGGGEAVFQAVHAAGILRDVAADGAGDLARRIGGVIEAGMLHRLADAEIGDPGLHHGRSEEHTYELQSLLRISYAAFCLKQNNTL